MIDETKIAARKMAARDVLQQLESGDLIVSDSEGTLELWENEGKLECSVCACGAAAYCMIRDMLPRTPKLWGAWDVSDVRGQLKGLWDDKELAAIEYAFQYNKNDPFDAAQMMGFQREGHRWLLTRPEWKFLQENHRYSVDDTFHARCRRVWEAVLASPEGALLTGP